MIFRKLGRIANSQRGFTLIEVIAVLAVTGLIGLGASAATVQILNQGSRNSDYVTAGRHAMNAIYWISLDAEMSQTVSPDGASGFPLTLSWTEWDNSEHQIVYEIDGDILRRSCFTDSAATKVTVVAQYINSASGNTTCEYTGGILTAKITATVGDGAHAVSITKTREIAPRPNL